MEKFDFVVIGSGPAGQKAAICAAKAGKKVLVVERERSVGGACVHHGTIPSKTLRETVVAMRNLARRGGSNAATLEEGTEVAPLMSRLQDVVREHEDYIEAQLRRNNVHMARGHARFIGTNKVEIRSPGKGFTESRFVLADFVILAVGSRPRAPKGVPVDHENILDSDSILSLTYLPRSLAVLGGGVVASEYASIFAALGVKVTVIDTNPRPMAFLDSDLTTAYLTQLTSFGSTYRGGCKIKEVTHDGLGTCEVHLEDGTSIQADKVLSALGRVANVEGLGLETVGITLTARGLVAVDEHCRTNVHHVYAVGDVGGPPSLASSAMEQGRRAVRHALGETIVQGSKASASDLPFCAYTIPEIASIGLSESEAIAKYGSAIVGRAPYAELARAHIAAMDAGMIKVIADPSGQRILGVQIVGENASELVHVGQMAILAGFEVDVLVEATFNFPTLAEGYRVAALDVVKQRGDVASTTIAAAAE